MGVLGQQDLTSGIDNVRRFGPRVPSNTSPNGQVIGDLWYDMSVLTLKAWNGSAWVGVASGNAPIYDSGLELYQSASTPFIDFHRAANPAGDGNADYSVRLINDVNGELRLFGNLRVHSDDVNGETFLGGWGGGGNYSCFANSFRKAANVNHYIIIHGGADANTYMSPGGVGGSIVFRAANNGADIATYAPTQINFQCGAGTDKFRFWNDGEFWCQDIGIGFGDNPNNSGIFFNSGNLNMNFGTIYFRTNNDAAHRIYYDTAGTDGPHLSGYAGLQFLFSNGGGTMQWDNTGQLFTNYGCGLDGAWILQSRFAGAATGGALRTKSGGNVFRTDWTGTMQFWIDVTNVKNFVIDHPLYEDKHLVHACIEGPEAAVFYRGRSELVNGWAEIQLPEYFESLCAEEGRSVQLTCIADNPVDEWCPVLHATYPKNGKFWVGLGSGVVVNDQKFWWEATAVRKDVRPVVAEPLRSEVEVGGIGPYTFIKERQ